MPNFDIVKKHKADDSFRTASIKGKFDLSSDSIEERFKGSIDIDDDWQIGLIVGASGTGKTTIAKQLFPDCYMPIIEFKENSVVDDMPKNKSVDEITKMFNSVGFSSPPSWLKSFDVLSNGEKMRVELAKMLMLDNELIVYDEFTSVVDRNVAKIGSHAVQKSIRKTDKKFIAVGCHYDVESWLQPDWVFYTDSMTFVKKKIKKDLKLNSKCSEQNQNTKHHYGKCLLNITI